MNKTPVNTEELSRPICGCSTSLSQHHEAELVGFEYRIPRGWHWGCACFPLGSPSLHWCGLSFIYRTILCRRTVSLKDISWTVKNQFYHSFFPPTCKCSCAANRALNQSTITFDVVAKSVPRSLSRQYSVTLFKGRWAIANIWHSITKQSKLSYR